LAVFSSEHVPRSSDSAHSPGADTDFQATKGLAKSEAGGELLTPELALVDPVLAQAQRQAHDRKVTMSSTAPDNGMFFTEQAQPAPAPDPNGQPAAPPAPADAPRPPDASLDSAQNVPLGTLIFRAGLVAENQLEEALEQGMRTGKRLGEVLLERGWLNDRDLGRMLAMQKGLEFVELSGIEPAPEALRALPEEKAKLQTALPLRFDGERLVVAVADPSNDLMLENLRRSVGHEPLLVVAPQSELKNAMGVAYAKLAAPPAEETLTEPTEPAPATASPPAAESSAPSLQPTAAPEVQPMPTVLPPAEERNVASTPVPPPVEEQAPPEPPAAPPAEEHPSLQPPPMSAQPVPASDTVSVQEPAAVVEVSEPAPQVEQFTAPLEADVEPEAVEPPAEAQPEDTVAPELKTHFVVLRLQNGDQIETDAYATGDEARRRAEEIVRELAAAETDATWPFFAQRFLRPDTIVSVDLVEHGAETWAGSTARGRLGHETP